MRARYPDYEPSVGRWIAKDPALPLRFNAMAALIKADPRPVILHVLHPWGGGTEKQVAEIVSDAESVQHLVLVTRKTEDGVALSLWTPEGEKWRRFNFSVARLGMAAPVLATFGVKRLHVHHALGIMDELPGFARALGVPYDLSIHDYALICPRNNLIKDKGRYCGEPDEKGCLSCLSRDPPGGSRDIIWWRQRGIGIIEDASRVLCPTIDVAARIQRYAPEADVIAVPHEKGLYHPARRYVAPLLAPGEKLRVAMLGVFAEHKGGLFLLECVERAMLSGAPVEWTLIGFFPPPLAQQALELSSVLTIAGPYDVERVQQLIGEADPHLIFFPQHCVETYSRRSGNAPMLGANIPLLEASASLSV